MQKTHDAQVLKHNSMSTRTAWSLTMKRQVWRPCARNAAKTAVGVKVMAAEKATVIAAAAGTGEIAVVSLYSCVARHISTGRKDVMRPVLAVKEFTTATNLSVTSNAHDSGLWQTASILWPSGHSTNAA